MQIDHMNHRITVYDTPTQDDGRYGQEETEPVKVCTIWAQFGKFNSGGTSYETMGTDANISQNHIKIYCRKNKKIKRGMYVVEGTDEYDILHVDNYRRDMTILIVINREVGI